MRHSALKVLFLSCVAAWISHSSYSAVFQEPVEGNTQGKTRYLFHEDALRAEIAPGFSQENPLIPSQSSIEQQYLPSSIDSEKQLLETTYVPDMKSSSSSSIKAYYQKATLESIAEIIRKYKSVPGGVTLEGAGLGLPDIQQVRYDTDKNIFVLNEKLIYKNPLSRYEMKEILLAIESDDLMGVSLGDEDVIYGALAEGSLPTIYLKLADHFLGCITFANNRWLSQSVFPNGYRPKENSRAGALYAVYFSLSHFTFETQDGEIIPSESHLSATLIPLTREKDNRGGYIPDYLSIAQGMFPSEYEQNINHIVTQMPYYEKEARVEKVNLYGQAAAFVRALKKKQISLSQITQSM